MEEGLRSTGKGPLEKRTIDHHIWRGGEGLNWGNRGAIIAQGWAIRWPRGKKSLDKRTTANRNCQKWSEGGGTHRFTLLTLKSKKESLIEKGRVTLKEKKVCSTPKEKFSGERDASVWRDRYSVHGSVKSARHQKVVRTNLTRGVIEGEDWDVGV